MSADSPAFTDALAALATPDTQRVAARMAQEVFALTFQQAAEGAAGTDTSGMAALRERCGNWCQAGATPDAHALRLALLISGLDQWGLAYSQAFGLTAIPALSALIGALRTDLDSQADARFQWFFSQIDQIEADAIDFKVELRRQIHLALWHAMAACERETEAEPILRTLGSLMLALQERMPSLGWRLLADAIAHIQTRLLGDTPASAMAQSGTQILLASLRSALPEERYQAIMAHATQAVLAWQQARRPA